MRLRDQSRTGGVAVEFAAVCPVAFTLILAIMIGGLAVFRFHELSTLAREAARYASVRGTDFQRVTGTPAATADNIRTYVLSKATGLDTASLTCNVSWNTSNAPYTSVYVNGMPAARSNAVTVTLTYQWIPEVFFTTGSTMTATS